MSPEPTATIVMPSAAPSEADIEAWRALPRDEQLRRLRETLAQADCATASSSDIKEILAEASKTERAILDNAIEPTPVTAPPSGLGARITKRFLGIGFSEQEATAFEPHREEIKPAKFD